MKRFIKKKTIVLLDKFIRQWKCQVHTGAESAKKILIHFRQWKCWNCQIFFFPSPISCHNFFFPSPILAMDCHNWISAAIIFFFSFPYFGNGIAEIATKFFFPPPISAIALPKLPWKFFFLPLFRQWHCQNCHNFFFLPLFRQCHCRNCHKIFLPFPYFGNAVAKIATNFFFPISTMALPNFTPTHRLRQGIGQ